MQEKYVMYSGIFVTTKNPTGFVVTNFLKLETHLKMYKNLYVVVTTKKNLLYRKSASIFIIQLEIY
jgi:hypothetical protein